MLHNRQAPPAGRGGKPSLYIYIYISPLTGLYTSYLIIVLPRQRVSLRRLDPVWLAISTKRRGEQSARSWLK